MEELKVTDIEFLHGCPQVNFKIWDIFGLNFVILWVPQGLQDPQGYIHLLNTRKYCDNTRKYCGNTHEYLANT